MSLDRYGEVTEREFQDQLLELLQYNGWLVYHTHDSRRSQPGFPDIVAIHPRTADIIVLECKTEKGRASIGQQQWLAAFSLCGIDARLVRPRDIDDLITRCRKARR